MKQSKCTQQNMTGTVDRELKGIMSFLPSNIL